MMTFRDKEQYSMLLGRICPHCIALAHDELERLLRTPRGHTYGAASSEMRPVSALPSVPALAGTIILVSSPI